MIHHWLMLGTSLCICLIPISVISQRPDKVLKHYGNCETRDYGMGRCMQQDDCEFHSIQNLDEESRFQCRSQQRPELICCPKDLSIIPAFAARINNTTNSTYTTTTSTPTERALSNRKISDILPTYPNCGTAFAFKIFGGDRTNILEFPWTTLLEYTTTDGRKEHNCGATFIAQQWLITAAHCVDDFFVRSNGLRLTSARLGEWNRTSNPDCITLWNGGSECVPPYIEARIDDFIIHPQFERNNLTNDIALLHLEQPVDWQRLQHVEPVCLPLTPEARANQLEGVAVDVSGWGRTKSNVLSEIKQKAVLHVKQQSQCSIDLRSQGYVLTPNQLCATGGVGVDSCNGDSGGPLTVEAETPQRERYVYLAGIVSYGKEKCGETDFPGVYTRVSSYIDWIEQSIRLYSVTH